MGVKRWASRDLDWRRPGDAKHFRQHPRAATHLAVADVSRKVCDIDDGRHGAALLLLWVPNATSVAATQAPPLLPPRRCGGVLSCTPATNPPALHPPSLPTSAFLHASLRVRQSRCCVICPPHSARRPPAPRQRALRQSCCCEAKTSTTGVLLAQDRRKGHPGGKKLAERTAVGYPYGIRPSYSMAHLKRLTWLPDHSVAVCESVSDSDKESVWTTNTYALQFDITLSREGCYDGGMTGVKRPDKRWTGTGGVRHACAAAM